MGRAAQGPCPKCGVLGFTKEELFWHNLFKHKFRTRPLTEGVNGPRPSAQKPPAPPLPPKRTRPDLIIEVHHKGEE